MLVGDDAMEVTGDGSNVSIDGPLVVIEHNDEALGLVGDVVQSFKGNAVGECRVSRNCNDMFVAASEIARHGHSEGSGKCRAGMARSVAIVLTLGAEHEAVQSTWLANGIEAIKTASQNLVDVGLMTYVKNEPVCRGVKDGVERQRQLDHSQI